MQNFDFWAATVFIILLFLSIYPAYLAKRKNSQAGEHKWDQEEAWRVLEHGGKTYPIRNKELGIWALMNRDERRSYINTLEKYLKNGTLRIEENEGVKMIVATDKGRKIRFDAIEFYKVNKHDHGK